MELSNIPEIDEEHKFLLAAFDTLRAKEGTNYDKVELQKEIDQLLANLEAHFVTEENVMFRVQYFDYDGHKQTHNDLLYLIKQIYNTIPRKQDQIFHIIGLIHKWVADHIDIESSLFRKLITSDPKYKFRKQ